MKYKFFPHTADIKFQAYGKTLEETFENSAYALAETITKKVKIKPIIKKHITIKGKDKETLLYKFLEEFIFLLDTENFLLSKIIKLKINKYLKAEIIGDKTNNYKITNDVKAITYNEMFIKKEKNIYITQVVLDV